MATETVLANLDLSQNELRNAVVQVLSSAPSSPQVGQIYFNSTLSELQVYQGFGVWSLLADNSGKLNGQAASYYLSRANHTGSQTASTISDLSSVVHAYTLDTFAVPGANVSFGGFNITNVADPTANQHAATKNYVDTQVQSAAAGIDSKPSVRLVSTSNSSLTGVNPTIDGVTGNPGDRVLYTAQTTASQNGVYVLTSSGSYQRAADADQNNELTPGAFWYVEEGATYGRTQWRIQNTGSITVGTTSITINQFGAASMYSAGNGLVLTGTVFAVQVASGSGVSGPGLVAAAGGLSIDTSLVPRKVSGTMGDGSTTDIAITHSLGTKAVVISVQDASNNVVLCAWTATSNNVVTFHFNAAPASGALSYTIIG